MLDAAVTGNYAYIADRDTGLRVVNVSDPAAPVEVGLYDMLGYAQNVGIAGSYAYVADRKLDCSSCVILGRDFHFLFWAGDRR
ncbi:MAG: hypothetical protein IPK53_10815 [bacterium]|nr:hypothetical protein [bacterium]